MATTSPKQNRNHHNRKAIYKYKASSRTRVGAEGIGGFTPQRQLHLTTRLVRQIHITLAKVTIVLLGLDGRRGANGSDDTNNIYNESGEEESLKRHPNTTFIIISCHGERKRRTDQGIGLEVLDAVNLDELEVHRSGSRVVVVDLPDAYKPSNNSPDLRSTRWNC